MKQTSSAFWDKINADYVAAGGEVCPEVWRTPKPAQNRAGIGGRPPIEATDEDREIRKCYEDGASLRQLAEIYPRSRTAISAAIQRAGGSLRSKKDGIRTRKSKVLTTAGEQELVRQYTAGKTLREVADAAGIGPDMVRRSLLAHGIETRNKSEAQKLTQQRNLAETPIDLQDLRRRYEAGESANCLANTNGIHRKTIRRLLLEAGTTLRSKTEALQLELSNRATQPEQENISA